MTVLLVEDHPGLAKISCDLLRDFFGHQVEHVATGAAAFATAMRSLPDLILLDLNLPDMHGYRLAEKLRAQRCLDRTIIVALTGHGITGNPQLSRAAGIDAHYRKPMDFGELVRIRRQRSQPETSEPSERLAGNKARRVKPGTGSALPFVSIPGVCGQSGNPG